MKKLVLINGNAVQGETIKFSLDSGFYTVENATYDGKKYDYLKTCIIGAVLCKGKRVNPSRWWLIESTTK